MRPGNDAERDYFPCTRCGHGTSFDSCAHSGHISADDDRDQPTAYLLPADYLNLSGFDHRVCRFDHSYPATGFNHAQGASHWPVSLLFKRQKIGDLTPSVKTQKAFPNVILLGLKLKRKVMTSPSATT